MINGATRSRYELMTSASFVLRGLPRDPSQPSSTLWRGSVPARFRTALVGLSPCFSEDADDWNGVGYRLRVGSQSSVMQRSRGDQLQPLLRHSYCAKRGR